MATREEAAEIKREIVKTAKENGLELNNEGECPMSKENQSYKDQQIEALRYRLEWELNGLTDEQRSVIEAIIDRPTEHELFKAERVANALYLANLVRAKLKIIETDLSKVRLLYEAFQFIDKNDEQNIVLTTDVFDRNRFEMCVK